MQRAAGRDNAFTIRAVQPGEEAALLQLILELAAYERLAHEVEATEARLHDALFRAGSSVEAALVREGEAIAGYALWFYNFSTFTGRHGLYLEDVYIRPEFRGRGYGEAVMRHLAGVADRRDCSRMEWAVLDWNEPAIGFYKRLGATAMDEWTVYRLKDDALQAAARG